MAAAKKKKVMSYKGKPVYRIGDTLYCGDLDQKFILALDIVETEPNGDINVATKVKIKIMDNTGEFGKGQIFRQSEKTDLYHAFDIGIWWLNSANEM